MKSKNIKEIKGLQRELDKIKMNLLLTESQATEMNKIIKNNEIHILKDISNNFRKEIYQQKSTVKPSTLRNIKASLKFNPNFSAEEIAERLQVPLITVIKADIDCNLKISTDVQIEDVKSKILLYSLIEELQFCISQIRNRKIKNIAKKFDMSVKQLKQLEETYKLNVIIG